MELPEKCIKYLGLIMGPSCQAKKIAFLWSLSGFYSGTELISLSELQETSGVRVNVMTGLVMSGLERSGLTLAVNVEEDGRHCCVYITCKTTGDHPE